MKQIPLARMPADAQTLHIDASNAGALFQVASQFNLLGMPSSEATPEEGISRHEGDPTQGPACAVAAGAGTICRNWFAQVDGELCQTSTLQIDCLYDVGTLTGNAGDRLRQIKSGYALVSRKGLERLARNR